MKTNTKDSKENQNHKIWEKIYSNRQEDVFVHSANFRWEIYLTASVLNFLPDKCESVLDVGCGEGIKTRLLAEIFPNADVKGVDVSETGIKEAIRKTSVKNISYVCCDVTSRDFGEQTENLGYSLVTSFFVLEHIDDWESMLKTICRLSNKYVLVAVPIGRMRKLDYLAGHYRNYKRGEIEEFMGNNGYKVVKNYYAGFPFYSPIERDLLSLVIEKHEENLKDFSYSGFTKFAHDGMYFLLRYCSLKSFGDNFFGLFERKNEV